MKNSKLIALLSAGALVLSSFSGLAVSGNSALAASQAKQRYSDGYFQNVVTDNVVTEPTHGTVTSWGYNRQSGKAATRGATAADGVAAQNYTGYLKNFANGGTPIESEFNDVYADGKGYAEALRGGDGDIDGTQYNYDGDRTVSTEGKAPIINKEIYAIWQNGYVGDDTITTWLGDDFDEESAPAVGANAQYIVLQSGEDGAGNYSAPSHITRFVGLSRSSDNYTGTLTNIKADRLISRWDHGVALYGLVDNTTFTLALNAKEAHYTQYNAYIFAGTNGDDDDGEYLPVHIAYPDAVLNETDGNASLARVEGARTVLYGGEGDTLTVNPVITNDLPHDQWIWEIVDDVTNSFVIEENIAPYNTKIKVKAAPNATKGATCKIKLYNSVKSDEGFVYDYTLTMASPNFYTDICLRADVDQNGNGVDYAGKTYTTNTNKAEIRATATMLVNEGATDIPQDQIIWTWTAKEKNENVRFTQSGVTGNIGTFEVANLDTVQSVTYIVRAYSVDQLGTGNGVFDESNTGANERMYGQREITVVFDKDFVPTITTDALPVGSGFTVDDANYVVTSDTEVEFAKYVGTATSYTVPAQVTFGNFTYNVTSVGKKAFASKTQLKEVTVPESVTVVGNGAFKNCKKLTSVTFLGNITNTPKNVFLKAGAKNGKKLKVSVGAGTSEETIKGLKKSNKNAKIK